MKTKRIIVGREPLPVPVKKLTEISDRLKQQHGKDVWMTQEGADLVFFVERKESGAPDV